MPVGPVGPIGPGCKNPFCIRHGEEGLVIAREVGISWLSSTVIARDGGRYLTKK